MKRLALAAPLAAAAATLALLVAAPAQAGQDIHWDVTGTFDDGSTLSGSFDVDQFLVMADWNLTTTASSSFDGFNYFRTPSPDSTANSSSDNTERSITTHIGGSTAFLRLAFVDSLFKLGNHNKIDISGTFPASFECEDSFSCFANDGREHTRHLISGFAVASGTSVVGEGGGGGAGGVPEPAAWALMLVGFGGIGAALRGASRRMAPAA